LSVRTEAEITGFAAGAGLLADGDGAGGTVTCAGSGGGPGGGWSLVGVMLPGVIEAVSGIVPSLTTSVNGTAAVVKVTRSSLRGSID
jgi:hypothetical protein